MTTKNEEIEKPEGGTPAPEVKTPPEKIEAKTPPAAAKVEPGKVEPKTEGGKKPTRVTNDDDEIPDDAELVELSPRALKSRISRATSKELKERFGTDKPEEIQAKLAKWADLETKEEERKRAALTEKERLEADLKSANERATQAERQAHMVAEDRVVERQDSRIGKLVGKFLDIEDEDARDIILRKLAKYLNAEYTAEELKTLKDSKIEKWAEEYGKLHPKHAKDAAPPPEKKPLTNTGDTRNSPPPAGKSGTEPGGKNFSPSAPGAMTPREARVEAAKSGLRW
jgi:hypothetical protein